MIFSPALTFGLLLATLYGALTHLIIGGSGRILLLYILTSWVGFAIGQATGRVMGIHIWAIGAIGVITGTLGSAIALTTAVLLSGRRGSDHHVK